MRMKHPNIVELEVWGDYALFTDPITKVGGEKCTYQIPTYEALKGILASVYWKPTFIWYVDDVRIMNQIQMESKGMRPLNWDDSKAPNDLAFYTYLKKVRYQVRAHFEWNLNRPEFEKDRNENKHHNMAKRMVEKGGRRDIFLGTRECQGYVRPCVFGEGQGAYDEVEEISFGLMYHGITYPDEAYSPETRGRLTVNLWNPVMRKGIVHFYRPEDCPMHRMMHKAEMKKFDVDKNMLSEEVI